MDLYHYTSEQALLGILTTNKLRAPISTQSNDGLDTIYLSNVLEKESASIFQKIIKRTPEFQSNPRGIELSLKSVLLKEFKSACSERAEILNSNARYEKCFVICFTSNRDSRFLWNAYTKNRGGCLKFNDSELKNFLDTLNSPSVHLNPLYSLAQPPYMHEKNSFTHYRFHKVIYEYDEQARRITTLLNDSLTKCYKDTEALSSSSTVVSPTYSISCGDITTTHATSPVRITLRQWILDFIAEAIKQLLILAPFIKHPYWREEDEYRLVLYRLIYDENLSTLKRYTNRGRSCDYIDFTFEKSLLKEVIVSPLFNPIDDDLKTYNCRGYSFTTTPSCGTGVLREDGNS